MLLIKFQFLIEKIDAEILVKLQKEILIFNKSINFKDFLFINH